MRAPRPSPRRPPASSAGSQAAALTPNSQKGNRANPAPAGSRREVYPSIRAKRPNRARVGFPNQRKTDPCVFLAQLVPAGFSAAGAETVIGNLWRVDDEVARVFFVAFYRELAQGSSLLGSFRQAQAQTRRAYPHTRDWGGFSLLGNPS